MWVEKEYLVFEGYWFVGGSEFVDMMKVDVVSGEGDGYGELFVE